MVETPSSIFHNICASYVTEVSSVVRKSRNSLVKACMNFSRNKIAIPQMIPTIVLTAATTPDPLLALALALDSPNQVLVQNPAANELRTFALHLEQNHLRLRADYGYVAQVND